MKPDSGEVVIVVTHAADWKLLVRAVVPSFQRKRHRNVMLKFGVVLHLHTTID